MKYKIDFLEIWSAAPYELKLHGQECRFKFVSLRSRTYASIDCVLLLPSLGARLQFIKRIGVRCRIGSEALVNLLMDPP